jgi:hypothetical protein
MKRCNGNNNSNKELMMRKVKKKSVKLSAKKKIKKSVGMAKSKMVKSKGK